MRLAREEDPLRWSLSPDMEKTLRDIGERGDIIKAMHRGVTERGLTRTAEQYIVHRGADRDGTAIECRALSWATASPGSSAASAVSADSRSAVSSPTRRQGGKNANMRLYVASSSGGNERG
jgi:hypothetical protein